MKTFLHNHRTTLQGYLPYFILFLLTFFASLAQAQDKVAVIGKVSDNNTKQPLPGATVVVVGSSNGTVTDQDGIYKLDLPIGPVKIQVSFVGYQTQVQSLTVIAGSANQFDFSLEEGLLLSEEVVIVGTRSTEGRSKIDSPAPVDIIQAKDIKATGQVDITQILNFVAPSINANRQPGGDGTAHIDPVALRGIAPDQTLVLINGKRRHGSALVNVLGTPSQGSVAVDFNSIPVASIERIEVLRDGAAAQYGSDAIAGVVNIVLKKETEKISLTSTLGAYNTSFRNKTDGALTQFDVNYGFGFGKGGFLNLTGQFNSNDRTNRTGYYELSNRLTGARQYWFSYPTNAAQETIDAQELSVDRYSSGNSGNSKQQSGSLFFNAALPLGNGAEVYS
ncbi:MAG: TonB-dependent receptor, partial [Cytophagales bacterium]